MSEGRKNVPGLNPSSGHAAPTSVSIPALTRYLVTCEHGGNRVGPQYRDLFAEEQELLASHRGYDPGALVLARQMARALGAPLVASMTSRLVVDLNRSIGHPRLHAPQICQATPELRDEILGRYYRSYRGKAERAIAAILEHGDRVIHISSHSFTPVLGHDVRRADIGLLYDPARPGERHLCEHWKATLHAHAPGLVVRRNYPYTGKSDGFCTDLRRRIPADRYIGIELEINQKHVFKGGRHWQTLRRAVVAALLEALHGPSPFGP